ncbi:MAG: UvrB/UvrC motif-containing protein [Verrucomicrobiota bacterium]|nr:UvrB/UvrC motif-containing protein [Verrucomicrobiota bacterium]
MGETLKCVVCGNPATVHLTQIVHNKIHKVDLCDECAKSKGVTDPEGFSLMELLASTVKDADDEPATKDALVCEHCGFTPTDFKKLGRFGCPSCYQYFKPILGPMLQNMHKDIQHRGKVPSKSLERVNLQQRLDELEKDLQDAIRTERYEDAAKFRDELSQLRAVAKA